MLPGGQVQEHRLEVGLNWGELRDVQALIGQQPCDDRKVELVIGQAHLENPVLEWLGGEACRSEYLRGPQMVRHSNTRR
jgi:serine protease inhibitor ecotin